MKLINPKKYNIFIDIDVNELRYNGLVKINLEITKDINEVNIDCKEIEVISIEINKRITKYNYNKKDNIIKIDDNFKKGDYEIEIKFKNKISDDLEGIYYIKEGKEIIICTQLEPDYARRVFPCFDKPQYKSIYDLTVKINNDLTCISNMPIEKIVNNIYSEKIVKFETTPKMSTYLLCIIIGNLKQVLDKPLLTNSGIKVNGYSIPKHEKYMNWSIEHTIKAIEYFEKWFNYKYQLPKLDIVSIPNFRCGAMENWGLITFREDYILLFDKNDDISKINILEVIYHEIAHQWFGNLVTMNDWSQLWLNESNATYFSWNALNDNYPEIMSKSLFNINEYKKALLVDGLKNTHPIIPKNMNNISDIFDEISYSKGSCLITYISGLLGNNNFKKSIQNYILENAYSNANSEDLYKYFKNGNINFDKLINDLISVKGYPLIEIEKDGNKLILVTQRFNLNRDIKEEYNTEFYIKMHNYNKNEDIIININSNKIIVDNINYDYYLNPDNELLCIIKYKNIKPNIKLLKQEEIIKYINDEFILMYNNYTKLDDYLNIIREIIQNTNITKDILIVITIINNINKLFYTLNATTNIKKYNELQEYINKYIKKHLITYIIEIKKTKVLYTNELINDILILLTIYLEDKKIIEYCKKKFITNMKKYKSESNKVFRYFKLSKSLFKIINKYYPEYSISIYNLINDDSNIINDIIESFEFIDSKYYNQIINEELYIKDIKLQNYSLLFSSISKNIKIQKDLIKYIIMNNQKLKQNNEIFLYILKNISMNIFNIELINVFTKYINLIKNNDNKITFDKILDILELNKNFRI